MHTCSTSPASPRTARRAFTLVEMLVVIGIMVLIIGAALPMLSHAMHTAQRTRAMADLQTISQALEHYRNDFRDYPRTPLSDRGIQSTSGAVLLCWALIAPGPAVGAPPIAGDGNEGPGFRIRGTQGQVYGPYLQTDKFRLKDLTPVTPDSPPRNVADDHSYVILDQWDHPIYYVASNMGSDPTAPNSFVADPKGGMPLPRYDLAYMREPDNSGFDVSDYQDPDARSADKLTVVSLKTMQTLLGDTSNSGNIDRAETATYMGPFLLWSAGPNGHFGIDPHPKRPNQSDDVTNFLP